jgi:hypothetical protein
MAFTSTIPNTPNSVPAHILWVDDDRGTLGAEPAHIITDEEIVGALPPAPGAD